jgi:hypothetical protein
VGHGGLLAAGPEGRLTSFARCRWRRRLALTPAVRRSARSFVIVDANGRLLIEDIGDIGLEREVQTSWFVDNPVVGIVLDFDDRSVVGIDWPTVLKGVHVYRLTSSEALG